MQNKIQEGIPPTEAEQLTQGFSCYVWLERNLERLNINAGAFSDL